MEDEKQGDVTVDLFAALDMEMEAAANRSSELENSQTLGLLMGFLAVDDWYLRSEYSVFGLFLFFFIFYTKFCGTLALDCFSCLGCELLF